MGWKCYQSSNTGVGVIGSRLAVGVYRCGDYPQLVVKLGDPIVDDLGWQQYDIVQFLFGMDDDRGKLRLMRRAPGYTLRREGTRVRHHLIKTRRVPAEMTHDPHKSEICQHIVLSAQGGLEVTLPDWFYRGFEGEPAAAKTPFAIGGKHG